MGLAAQQELMGEVGRLLDELVGFCREHGAPCFVRWPDNILREYLAFHGRNKSLYVVRDEGMQMEAPETLAHQFRWLAEGRRRAVLVTGDGKAERPGVNASWIRIPEGTLYFSGISLEEVQGFLERDELGLLLGYGVPRKPAGGIGCVVLRDENGIEKQAVVVDSGSLPIAWAASQAQSAPTDRLEFESFEDVLLSRRLAGAPPPPVLALGVGWQVNEAEIEKHWRITDPRGDAFYFAHVIAREPRGLPLLAAAWQERTPCWARLKLFSRRKGALRRYSAKQIERVLHVIH